MRFPSRSLFRLLPWLAVLWFSPLSAQAQVNRCTTPAGQVVYTDKSCAAIGASDRVPRGPDAAPLRSGTSAYRGCARNLQDLLYEITAAIDNRDVNRLGGVYHWIGVSPAGGERVLERLQSIVDRPLVDIVPIRARAAVESAPPPEGTGVSGDAVSNGSSSSTLADAPLSAETSAPLPSPPRTRNLPSSLRLEQTLRNSGTPSRTYFGLRRHLDCWWITF
jgi:Domain of unknown function (DUF4124)